MSRYTGQRARIVRRFSQSIFTSGNAKERKPYIPGMHGPTLRRMASEYGMSFNEKQKACYIYGMSEKQFKLAFNKVKNTKGFTSTLFLVHSNLGWIAPCIIWGSQRVALQHSNL
jgi:small subunit ribosomal protein S4